MGFRILFGHVALIVTLSGCQMLDNVVGNSKDDVNSDIEKLEPFYDPVSNPKAQQMASIESDVDLPSTGKNGSTVSWSSSDPTHFSKSGKVTRSSTKDSAVQLTATVAKGDVSKTKKFDVIVIAQIPLPSIGFMDASNWMQLDSYNLKTMGTDSFSYLAATSTNYQKLQVSLKVNWRTSTDFSGIIFRKVTDSSSNDGYYFLLYPYQSAYRILKVIGGVETLIEQGECDSNTSNAWVSLAVEANRVSGQPTQFKLYVRNQLVTTIQDSSLLTWTSGWGTYKWDPRGGNALFSNITENF